ncbi:hypothetical protein RQM59_05240 [Flavobacteriaceae bacterium S356]|uniref:MarR family transcriptional regulator n=1 Tax=Asprobacillus argus TaxID=3076534 RepID=A0ABU3LF18_9FLAO|nr:hypothetical protein [Flavobacteriaceae bacterium S356]
MKQEEFTLKEQSVINVLQERPKTSFEILQQVEGISLLLVLYRILDQLHNKGALLSYMKEDVKYHYVR